MRTLSKHSTIFSIIPTNHPNFDERRLLIAQLLSKYPSEQAEMGLVQFILSFIAATPEERAKAAQNCYQYLDSLRKSGSAPIAGLDWLYVSLNLGQESRQPISWEVTRKFHPLVALLMAEPGYDLTVPLTSLLREWEINVSALALSVILELYPRERDQALDFLFQQLSSNAWNVLLTGHKTGLFDRGLLTEVSEIYKPTGSNTLKQLSEAVGSSESQAVVESATHDDIVCPQSSGRQLYVALSHSQLSQDKRTEALSLMSNPDRLAQLKQQELKGLLSKNPQLLPAYEELQRSGSKLSPSLVKLMEKIRAKEQQSLRLAGSRQLAATSYGKTPRPTSPLPRECGFSTCSVHILFYKNHYYVII